MESLNKNAVAIREIGNSERCFIDHEKTNATIRESQQVEASIISFGFLDFPNYQGQREPCTDSISMDRSILLFRTHFHIFRPSIDASSK